MGGEVSLEFGEGGVGCREKPGPAEECLFLTTFVMCSGSQLGPDSSQCPKHVPSLTILGTHAIEIEALPPPAGHDERHKLTSLVTRNQ